MAPAPMAAQKPQLPPNIVEFNTIVGLVFAQLYRALPIPADIDHGAIAAAFDVGADRSVKLPSGQSFSDMVGGTLFWLKNHGFITSKGEDPGARVVLSVAGLATMNAMPPGLGLKQSIGSELVEAVDTGDPGTLFRRVGQLAGSLLGNAGAEFLKSMASG
jgi:hypothetical protein